MNLRAPLAALACALAMSCLWAAEPAQDYPTKPVTIIAPSQPGGGFDLMGRAMAEGLTKQFGKTFVVENRTGSGTLVGTQAAVAAQPDGHTLLVGGLSNLVFNAALYKTPQYDPRSDFTTIGLVATYPYVLVARADLPFQDYKGFIDYAKAHPDKLAIATGGPGSGQHIMGRHHHRMNSMNATTNDSAALDLFTEGRTQNGWLSKPVDSALLTQLYDLVRMGPTSMNCQPMRLVLLTSAAQKQRLMPALSPGNVEKTQQAPVTRSSPTTRASTTTSGRSGTAPKRATCSPATRRAVQPPDDTRGHAGHGRRAVRGRAQRRGEGDDRAAVWACGCGCGASGS